VVRMEGVQVQLIRPPIAVRSATERLARERALLIVVHVDVDLCCLSLDEAVRVDRFPDSFNALTLQEPASSGAAGAFIAGALEFRDEVRGQEHGASDSGVQCR